MARTAITVRGKVQRVFYRKSAQEKAASLGLTGFVRNESDGNVYIEAQGDERQLERLQTWAQEGPDGAAVNHVTTERLDPIDDERDFSIR